PSPTGPLHLGHAMAAIYAFDMAREYGTDGRFLLRMEDIDTARTRPEFEQAIFTDLEWLGLEWETPVRRQSEHMADYASALRQLDEMGLLYPCFCTRGEIQAEIERSQTAPHMPTGASEGPDGPLYPGTCLKLGEDLAKEKMAAQVPYALRLNMQKALSMVADPLMWTDTIKGEIKAAPEIFQDVVLARKDVPTSYHLAVSVDDHLQGVNMVTRGEDLFSATHVHRLIQALLRLDVPTYSHHGLVSDNNGQRLAKRDKATTLKTLRESGYTPTDIRNMVGLKTRG
ncbi:MAG: tRNA glutamyl-Q(34) synthetase GluQRS, partial [Rhodospirillaceae bacterium]|nr:tRNA glutamyl-Q(34) synthetase GluQRS [Rhodospirillaceae bacterium]